MIKRMLSVVIILSLLLVNASVVHSLSCAAPQMDENIVNQTEIIAEGWISKMRDLSRIEKSRMKKANITSKGGDLSDFKAFELKITKAYKGAKKGDRITIYRNIYWGDTFSDDDPYFVAIPKKIAGFNIVPLCGHTILLKFAKKQGWVDLLQQKSGGK